MIYTLRILILSFILLTACDSGNNMDVKIVDRMFLDQIPSASGIELIDDKFYIIGDNLPWLFEMQKDYNVINKYIISSLDPLVDNVIPKAFKLDFEAMTKMDWDGNQAIFIFGSGSKSPQRNFGKLVKFSNVLRVETFDLTSFYSLLMKEANLTSDELNIEAAAVMGNKLFLFNRGKNKLITIKLKDFQNFLSGTKTNLKMKVITIDLPEIDGVQAGFSGATADESNNRIVFTGSVENTSNWIDDGSVYGSLIGIINEKDLVNHFAPHCEFLKDKNEILAIKAESITVTNSIRDNLKCIIVTDADGGTSELIEVELKL